MSQQSGEQNINLIVDIKERERYARKVMFTTNIVHTVYITNKFTRELVIYQSSYNYMKTSNL